MQKSWNVAGKCLVRKCSAGDRTRCRIGGKGWKVVCWLYLIRGMVIIITVCGIWEEWMDSKNQGKGKGVENSCRGKKYVKQHPATIDLEKNIDRIGRRPFWAGMWACGVGGELACKKISRENSIMCTWMMYSDMSYIYISWFDIHVYSHLTLLMINGFVSDCLPIACEVLCLAASTLWDGWFVSCFSSHWQV